MMKLSLCNQILKRLFSTSIITENTRCLHSSTVYNYNKGDFAASGESLKLFTNQLQEIFQIQSYKFSLPKTMTLTDSIFTTSIAKAHALN
jgi:spermidine synthase